MAINNLGENTEKQEAEEQTLNLFKAWIWGFSMIFFVIYWIYLIIISIASRKIGTCSIFLVSSSHSCIYATYPDWDYFALLGLVIILFPIFLIVGWFFSLAAIIAIKEWYDKKFNRKI